MELEGAAKVIEESIDGSTPKEVFRALAAGHAMADLIKGKEFGFAVGGVALGVALGEWLKSLPSLDVEAQEKALDSVLAVAARTMAGK